MFHLISLAERSRYHYQPEDQLVAPYAGDLRYTFESQPNMQWYRYNPTSDLDDRFVVEVQVRLANENPVLRGDLRSLTPVKPSRSLKDLLTPSKLCKVYSRETKFLQSDDTRVTSRTSLAVKDDAIECANTTDITRTGSQVEEVHLEYRQGREVYVSHASNKGFLSFTITPTDMKVANGISNYAELLDFIPYVQLNRYSLPDYIYTNKLEDVLTTLHELHGIDVYADFTDIEHSLQVLLPARLQRSLE